MANVLAPNGFSESRRLGAAVNYQMSTRQILSSNATAIYKGDPVSLATGTTGVGTGYVQQASPVTTISITSLSWTAGVMTVTASAQTVAVPVGAILVFSGFSTATALNGTWGPVTSSTTTTTLFNFPVTQSTDTGTMKVYIPITGIFIGCSYPSLSAKKIVELPYWPGTTTDVPSGGLVYCKVIDDPLSVFRVQGNGQITQAMVGQSANFAIGTGSTVTGYSGASLDTSTSGSQPYLPFRIVNLIIDPPGVNGTDSTTAYNLAEVAFNNQDYRSLIGL